MLQDFPIVLNNMLTQAFHNILRLEEEYLQKSSRINLSIREMHLIECIGECDNEEKTASEIADFLRIARPSATVAIKKLEQKGYLSKSADGADGRFVRIALTREGRKIFRFHKRYHSNLVAEISKGFDEDEQGCLIRAINKLNEFFEKDAENAK